ncbi:hypothetical protein F9288_15925 [Sphingomonas sp. CL5.1]|uniref:septal ring lytic transglycosylase RlpA family protein n=1 Tax=Sphingomonas sp. CL5.1 TaxID=2653203 RepID=UPI001583440F|nr:septal ring lytic transglycosylase RlpA family protein [Sphingomonas sp. CL5.1]QKS00946.1 hypothetical protein F9288_15925 [Sphingomonas sp. CL5.1]
MRLSVSVALLALPLAAVCHAGGDAPRPAASYDEVGYATWYGEELAGVRTASGAPFRPSAITAAHRTLPLDLSRGAAALLGTGGNSRAAVRVRAVAAPADRSILSRDTASPEVLADLRHRLPGAMTAHLPRPPLRTDGRYIAQATAFYDNFSPNSLASRRRGSVDSRGRSYRVRLGSFDDADAAQRARDDAARRGYGDASIVVQP